MIAARIGFPLLVKASAGGGGIGMKRVDDPAALTGAIKSVQAHAERLYGNPQVFLEKVVMRARHVEVQVFGFGDGEATHLHGRECSIQRRYQKVIEESTGPLLDQGQMKRMYDAALSLVRQEHYSGAGTVEFLYDDVTHEFYFLEMNTRIQVEHAVSEMITGVDLVEMQIRQAAGEALAEMRGKEVQRQGHAIECRLYAEDPSRSFYPSPGPLLELELPIESAHVRVDTGVQAGDVVTPFYDPMISKIVSWGETRDSACEAMRAALAQVKVVGVKTNLTLLQSILSHADFAAGRTHTRFIEDHAGLLTMQAASPAPVN
jgi:3-methylcrotonyl-CoA carboxylase alpha subunit